jgi:hypothetical protein
MIDRLSAGQMAKLLYLNFRQLTETLTNCKGA